MLRYLTGGESHGKCLVAILDGVPSGLRIGPPDINADLRRRKAGYGRGKRMSIESDSVKILSGVRKGVTIGSPITVMVGNADSSIDSLPAVLHPRPGHADLAGALKYGLGDIRSVLERASARETAARVAVGAVCRKLLAEFGVRVASHVIAIGSVGADVSGMAFDRIVRNAESSPVRCADAAASKLMCGRIDRAIAEGDTLGGMFEVIVRKAPPGLGSYAQWDLRIDARLAAAVMSIQAVKGVSLGIGFEASGLPGSDVHDGIYHSAGKGFYRKTNNAGGVEGGMTNGEDVVVRAFMKPIATLRRPLPSVDIRSKRPVRAAVERSDTCAVPAAGVVGEAVVAFEIACAMAGKFGGDSLGEMKRNFDGYLKQIGKF
jgi:chorismate synthase